MVSALTRSFGLPAPVAPIGDLVTALARAGVFRLRSVLVGTVAYQSYPAILGIKLSDALLQASDVDIAQFTSISVALGDQTWLEEADEDRVFLSVATLAELRHGVERLAPGARRKKLDSWLREELPLRFESRVLAVTEDVADEWGRVTARCEAGGRPLSAMDGLIASTAIVHSLTLVTRNTSDFEVAIKSLLNPWS